MTFDASASSDPGGQRAKVVWELGDGATAGVSKTSHSHTRAGVYTAKLTVTLTDDADALTRLAKVAFLRQNRLQRKAAKGVGMTDESKDTDDLTDMEPDEELEDLKLKEGDTDDIVGGTRRRAQGEQEGT